MMIIRTSKGLTFDDVLLLPRRSSISSRNQVDTSTRLTENIRINIPVISANMDTVTEAAMAISMAKAGGIGIIHRFMPIELHVKQIKLVKRAQAVMVADPYCINLDASVDQAREMMHRFGVGGLLVTDEANKVMGIITSRDVNLAPTDRKSVKQVMTLLQKGCDKTHPNCTLLDSLIL